MTKQKVAITERALVQRINRKLRQQANPEQLRSSRTEVQAEELGNYFTVDAWTPGAPQRHTSKGVCRTHVNLTKLGRELGALEPWEELAK